ncbi:MAG: hypothetical protein WBF09_07345, partial [Candidatus Acidiferrum sp.]
GIPMTLTRKKMEVPVRKILMGVPPERAANRNAMTNPESLAFFVDYANTQKDYSLATSRAVDGRERESKNSEELHGR